MINPTLFSMNFSARSSAVKRCELCYATTHTETECAQHEDRDPDVGARLCCLETAVLAMARPPVARQPNPPAAHPARTSGEACQKWNGTGSSYPRCWLLPECSACWSNHPATRCDSGDQDTLVHLSGPSIATTRIT